MVTSYRPSWGGNSKRTDSAPMLDWFQEHGCRGIGEVTANLPFDDPRTTNLFGQIGRRGISAGEAERRSIAELIDEMLASGRAGERTFAAVNWHNGVMPQRRYLETLAEQARITRTTLDGILGKNAERLLVREGI